MRVLLINPPDVRWAVDRPSGPARRLRIGAVPAVYSVLHGTFSAQLLGEGRDSHDGTAQQTG